MNLEIGRLYTKKEIEEEFDTNFGHSIKGITLRKMKDGTPYIILFSTPKGREIYGDDNQGDVFKYRGEGAEGDQKMTTANKVLKESNETSREIYGFHQENKGDDYEYLGKLKVMECQYVNVEDRKVYEYILNRV